MEVDDIISYHDLVTEEKIALQKGMNYGVGKKYSVFLMSLRENAPYADALDPVTGMLTYEGHNEPQRQGGPNPKELDQPLTTPKGSWTENGKFLHAVHARPTPRGVGLDHSRNHLGSGDLRHNYESDEGGVAPSETWAIALSRDGLVAANRDRAAGFGHSDLRIVLVSCGRNRLYDWCAIFR
jgi:hypothetical protein